MRFGAYEFYCHLNDEALLPPYKGSTFRGLLGRGLKGVVCALRQTPCVQCLLRSRCLYASMFEAKAAMPPGTSLKRLAAPPPPFVLQPPLAPETRIPAGTQLMTRLLLFGDLNGSLPYLVYAFQRMGEIGLGIRKAGQRAPFVLKEVRFGLQTLYRDEDGDLSMPEEVPFLDPTHAEGTDRTIRRVELELVTPLRLKFENRLTPTLPFHLLTRAMLRRISGLMTFYGEGEPSLDYRGLVQRAHNIQIAEQHLSWYDWRRFSFARKEAMLLGGLVGRITYEGSMGEFMPLLRFCAEAHLGKQTSFGLGMIRMRASP